MYMYVIYYIYLTIDEIYWLLLKIEKNLYRSLFLCPLTYSTTTDILIIIFKPYF